MKKRFFKTGIPLLLLAFVTLFIGSGCFDDPSLDYWYLDNDGDGYGDNSVPNIHQQGQPAGYVLDNTDCDDTDDLIHPGATEIPDNDVDEDCNDLYAYTFYLDNDNDGFGENSPTIIEIEIEGGTPEKYVTNNVDCDDNDMTINILADEIMGNGIDDNCNGLIDAEDIRYLDIDGDGYGSQEESAADGVFNNLDCDDQNPDVHPYAIEIEDGIDNDCDGIVD